MPTIDEIFDAMPAETSVNYEELIIDAESRRIRVPDVEKIFGVESDTQAERKHFRCPRYVGAGLDLAGCFLRVNFRNANGEVDAYLITDVTVDGEDVTFSWELSRKVTAYKGEVQFVVCAIMGAGLPEWNTTLTVGTVLEGLEPDSSTAEAETADVIAQLLAMVTAQTAAVEAVGAAQCEAVREVGENATEEAKAAMEAKGAAVVASIPDDYTALSATVDRLTRDRAAAIVCEAEGETIQVNDSSADPLVGLRLFGKSTQGGTPTPEAPVEIVSAKAPTVTVCGKNLVNASAMLRDGFMTEANGVFTLTKGTQRFSKTQDCYIPANRSVCFYAERLKYSGSVDFWMGFNLTFEDGSSSTVGLYVNGAPHTVRTYTKAIRKIGLFMSQDEPAGAEVQFKNLQVELSAAPTEYEPYRGSTLTLSTPDSLPGIPVASGGNYTDANGQQWIADEVDLARGVYVQRVGRLVLDGSAKWNAYNYETTYYGFHIWDLLDEYHNRSAGMCNQFETVGGSSGDCVWVGASNANVYAISKEWYDRGLDAWKAHLNENPLEVIYVRITPVETPLSTEEIEAYKALLANKPTTTVLNDAGAWMALEYAADPKTYIDNKIKEAMNL